jgi:hypothetical protein
MGLLRRTRVCHLLHAMHAAMSAYLRHCLSLAVLSVFLSCGGGESQAPPAGPLTLRILSGAGQSDSIDARQASPLVAQVTHDNGQPAVGIAVRFSVLAAQPELPGLKVQPSTTAPADSMVVVQTDASGRATVLVINQSRTGVFAVVVTADGVPGQVTSTFTVTAGRAHALTIGTRDTLLYVGRSVTPSFTVTDRLGNSRSGSLTSSVSACRIDVTQVTGVSVGRCAIMISAPPLLDSVHVSVVPVASILAIRNEYDAFKTPRLVSMGLDGSGYTELAPLTYVFPGELLMPLRAPDGRRITMHSGSGDYSTRITVFDSSMAPRTFRPQGVTTRHENWARFSADGQWLIFSSRASLGEAFTVWRARPDGSEAERITPPGQSFGFHSNYADITPDGRTIVYVDHALRLSVIDVASRTVRVLTKPDGSVLQAFQLRLSPDGRRVAFVFATSGYFGMHIINVDGTGYRPLSQAFGYDTGDVPFDWTADGEWILTRRHEFISTGSGSGIIFFREWVLLNAQTGSYVPLPYKTFTPTSMMIDR